MKRFVAFLIAIVLILLIGCNGNEYEGEVIEVYFLRDISAPISDGAVAAVKYPAFRYSDKVEAAIGKLLSEPEVEGLHSPFPEGVKLVGIDYSGDVVTVHLSEEYGEMFGEDLAAANVCTVLTLCGIDGVNAVSITVDGKQHPAISVDRFTADSVVTGDFSFKPVEFQALLYFSDGNTEYVVEENKNIIIRENESIAKYVVEELIKGPDEDSSAEGYKRIIHPDAKLLKIEIVNNICYVNFSKEFLEGIRKSRAIEVQTLYSITNSLCALDGINGVQYLVEGEKIYGNEVMRRNETVIGAYYDPSVSERLYVVSSDGKYLESLLVRIEAVTGYELERLIVEKLIAGIDGYGFMSMLPKGTMLLGIDIDKYSCIINFSKEFIVNDHMYDRELIIQSIVLSLTEANENIRNVRILVNGNDINNGEPYYPDYSLVGVG